MVVGRRRLRCLRLVHRLLLRVRGRGQPAALPWVAGSIDVFDVMTFEHQVVEICRRPARSRRSLKYRGGSLHSGSVLRQGREEVAQEHHHRGVVEELAAGARDGDGEAAEDRSAEGSAEELAVTTLPFTLCLRGGRLRHVPTPALATAPSRRRSLELHDPTVVAGEGCRDFLHLAAQRRRSTQVSGSPNRRGVDLNQAAVKVLPATLSQTRAPLHVVPRTRARRERRGGCLRAPSPHRLHRTAACHRLASRAAPGRSAA